MRKTCEIPTARDFIKWCNKTANKQTNKRANFSVRAWVSACMYVRANRCVCVCGRSLTVFGLSWIALPIFMDLTSLLFLFVCIPRYSLNMRNWWTKQQQPQHQQQRQTLWVDTFDIVIFMFSLKSKSSPILNGKTKFVAFAAQSFVQMRNPIQIKCHPLMSYCHSNSNCEWRKMITVIAVHWTTKKKI